MEKTYLSVTETAKLVRAALKRAFPKTKFSVRSDKDLGGASIDISWIDGPSSSMVEPVAKQFQGGGFDGMIDLKTSHTSWLMPDGSACVATNEGTVGSRGTIPPERNWMPDPDAKLVRFQADFIFCHRKTSTAMLKRVLARLEAKGYPVEVVEVLDSSFSGEGYIKLNTYSREAMRGFDMEREVWEAVSRTHIA